MPESFWIWNSGVKADPSTQHAVAIASFEQAMRGLVAGVHRSPGLSLVGKNPFEMQLSSELHLSGILGKADLRDSTRLLLVLLSKHELTYEQVLEQYSDIAVEVMLTSAHSHSPDLELALACDTPLLSLELGPWREPQVEVLYRRLEDDGLISTEALMVGNVANADHVPFHETWFEGQVVLEADASGLWKEADHQFPHLVFLPDVERQLAGLGRKEFSAVQQRLYELERATAAWDPVEDPAPSWFSYVTPESATRSKWCWFAVGPQRFLFSLHARYTPTEGRIHFRLLPAERKLQVAYVGIKLGI